MITKMFFLKSKVYASLSFFTDSYPKGCLKIIDNRRDSFGNRKCEGYIPNDIEIFHSEKKTIESLKLNDLSFLEEGEACVIRR